jgi:predicted DNA-binding transcriptional regulator AlpA
VSAIQPAALSVTDAAAYLGVSRKTMYRISAERGTGGGPCPVEIRGRRVFRVKDLDAYLDRQQTTSVRRPA